MLALALAQPEILLWTLCVKCKDKKVVTKKADHVPTRNRPVGPIAQYASSCGQKGRNFRNEIQRKNGLEILVLAFLGVVVKLKLRPLGVAFLFERVYNTTFHDGPLDDGVSILDADNMLIQLVLDFRG